MTSYPFLQPEFLQALELSGSVCTKTGWTPQHIEFAGSSGNKVLLPLYLKSHSWGEYVFDWSWADAYHRNGLDYYPKLLTAVPFTPATGPRLISDKPVSEQDYLNAIELAIDKCQQLNLSGWHCLFPDFSARLVADHPQLLHRSGIQYHWHNRGYNNFDDFLGTLKSRKRKMIRRERASCQDFQIEVLEGQAITPALWSQFYQLYVNTYLKRSGSNGYLTEDFFQRIGRTLPEQTALAVAKQHDQLVAAALYFCGNDTLYGRYWGCSQEFEHLHFELCYYQGIEFAMKKQLKQFDAGAQGEHKLARGFEPVITHSYHWINHPAFRSAIQQFLEDEQHQIAHWHQEAQRALPYK